MVNALTDFYGRWICFLASLLLVKGNNRSIPYTRLYLVISEIIILHCFPNTRRIMLPGHCSTNDSAAIRHLSVGEPDNNHRKHRPTRLQGVEFGQPNGMEVRGGSANNDIPVPTQFVNLLGRLGAAS